MSFQRLVLFFSLALVVQSAAAQERPLGGFIGGVTTSEFRGEEGFGFAGQMGFSVGLFGAIPVRGPLGAQIEVSYRRRGFGLDEYRDANNVGGEAEFRFDYVSLLASPQYRAPWGASGLRFYTFLGPRLDVLVAERATILNRSDDRVPFDQIEGLEPPEAFESVVFGFSTGVGIDLVRLGVPLVIELRYDADVTPAQRFEGEEPRVFAFESRFRTFGLRVGLSF